MLNDFNYLDRRPEGACNKKGQGPNDLAQCKISFYTGPANLSRDRMYVKCFRKSWYTSFLGVFLIKFFLDRPRISIKLLTYLLTYLLLTYPSSGA